MLFSGFGLGLRSEHIDAILASYPKSIDWFEIISENYLTPGGRALYNLNKIREQYPIAMHGVSLSIGNTTPLDWEYLKQLKYLKEKIDPFIISDHLCWTGMEDSYTPDLLPLPQTDETIEHIVERVKLVQNFLETTILLENVSSYVKFKDSSMTEWQFLSTIASEAKCQILLDINNIYVSSFNHGFEPYEYLNGIPRQFVSQFHLAGHYHKGSYIIDTHGTHIIKPVWNLYVAAIKRFGLKPTLIERDDNIPSLEELVMELEYARKLTI